MKTSPPLNALLAAVTLLLFTPTWIWLIEAWWSDPYYTHGPLVPLIALYFAWVSRKTFADPTRTPNNGGLVLIALALGGHLWALIWRAYYLSGLMIPLALFGLAITLYGWRVARQFLFPITFLILMIPLPLAERFGPVLEGWATISATTLAQRLGVAAHNVGAEVYLPNSTFTIGIPCGGLRSVIAIITLATLLAYIVHGAWWARAIVFLAAVPIALAANTLRIALLFAIANTWGAEAGLGYFHDWSSPILFIGAFSLLLALAKLLRCGDVRWEIILPE